MVSRAEEKNGHEIVSMTTVTKMPQYTTHPLEYGSQSRMKNRHGVMSTIIVTRISQYTTH